MGFFRSIRPSQADNRPIHSIHAGCGWTGGKGAWPDHLRRECPEVEDDNNPERQVRAGSVPLAIRAAAAVAVAPEPRIPLPINEEEELEQVDGYGPNAALLDLNDKKVGTICDACHSEIFNYGFKCASLKTP